MGPGALGSRARLYSRAAMFAVAVAFVVSIVGASGANSAAGRLGGDFPAFYSAGSIVAAGDWESLYEPDRQLEAQQELFEGSDSSYLYFAYPPYVASLYRPLAALDYRLAYAVHTLLMAAALVGALAVLRPVIPVLRRHTELLAIATLLFYPMLRAVTGGQNTGLTVLLLAVAWRALHDENDALAGVALGMLLYKPQLALPFLGVLLLARRWKATAAGAATGLVLWAFGAAVMGVGWLGGWWTQVSEFSSLDADINGYNAVSWLGFAQGWLGADSTAAVVLAAPLMLATAVGLSALWALRIATLNVRMALTIVGAIMLAPHAMFYDVGAIALAGLVAFDRLGRRALIPVVAVWVLAWTQVLASPLGFAPLFFVLVPAGIWLGIALIRDAEALPEGVTEQVRRPRSASVEPR